MHEMVGSKKGQSSVFDSVPVLVITIVFIILLLVIVGVYILPRMLNPSG